MLIEMGIVDAENIVRVLKRCKHNLQQHDVDYHWKTELYLLGAVDQAIAGMQELIKEAGHTVE